MLRPTIGDSIIEEALKQGHQAKTVLDGFCSDKNVINRVQIAIDQYAARPPHTIGSSEAQAIRLELVKILSEDFTS